MYYFNPFEANAAVDQYERTVAENLAACEAIRETSSSKAGALLARARRPSWFGALRAPMAVFHFHRHA